MWRILMVEAYEYWRILMVEAYECLEDFNGESM